MNGRKERSRDECGCMKLLNRESPRINANRIFLAPSCSAPAYRLRRNRTPSGKMLGKNPRAGFSIFEQFSLLHLTACFQIYCLLEKRRG